jgi:hypothetical protein
MVGATLSRLSNSRLARKCGAALTVTCSVSPVHGLRLVLPHGEGAEAAQFDPLAVRQPLMM